MSEFLVEVVQIAKISPIEEADRIEVAFVGDYQVVVGKGEFSVGDLAAYIPEGSIVPEDILKELNLVGKLAGNKKDRVKAIKLRSTLSQGLLYPLKDGKLIRNNFTMDVKLGDDVATHLGITKWNPPIPTQFEGLAHNIGLNYASSYEFDNIKRHPDDLEGRQVQVTEKIHGTFMAILILPKQAPVVDGFFGGKVFVTSKGLLKKGQVLLDKPGNESNSYVQALKKLYDAHPKFKAFIDGVNSDVPLTQPIYILGELFGNNIQDLKYSQPEHTFAVFDVWGDGKFMGPQEAQDFAAAVGLNHVPVYYEGEFNKQDLDVLTTGETAIGDDPQIREGVVFKTLDEPRIVLKSVSEQYLLRKDGTEYV